MINAQKSTKTEKSKVGKKYKKRKKKDKERNLQYTVKTNPWFRYEVKTGE